MSLNILNILHILLLSSKSPCVLKIVVNFIIKCVLIILIGHILMKYKSSIIPPKNLCFSFYFLSLNFLDVPGFVGRFPGPKPAGLFNGSPAEGYWALSIGQGGGGVMLKYENPDRGS
jgi:hypothetical protein